MIIRLLANNAPQDSFKDNYFLWVTSKGIAATKGGRVLKQEENAGPKGSHRSKPVATGVDSDDEDDANERGRTDMDG